MNNGSLNLDSTGIAAIIGDPTRPTKLTVRAISLAAFSADIAYPDGRVISLASVNEAAGLDAVLITLPPNATAHFAPPGVQQFQGYAE